MSHPFLEGRAGNCLQSHCKRADDIVIRVTPEKSCLYRDCINAKIMHFYTKCFPKNAFFEFVMRPWDANIETCSHRSSFMGPLQNSW